MVLREDHLRLIMASSSFYSWEEGSWDRWTQWLWPSDYASIYLQRKFYSQISASSYDLYVLHYKLKSLPHNTCSTVKNMKYSCGNPIDLRELADDISNSTSNILIFLETTAACNNIRIVYNKVTLFWLFFLTWCRMIRSKSNQKSRSNAKNVACRLNT